MTECQGLLGKVFGHRYVARYSRGKPIPYEVKTGSAEGLVKILQATKDISYEGDICTRCGNKIMKGEK